MRAGWVVAYGSFVAMGGPSVLPRARLGPRLPKGALHPRIAGSMLVLPDQHDQGTYMRYGGGSYLPPPVLYSLVRGSVHGRSYTSGVALCAPIARPALLS